MNAMTGKRRQTKMVLKSLRDLNSIQPPAEAVMPDEEIPFGSAFDDTVGDHEQVIEAAESERDSAISAALESAQDVVAMQHEIEALTKQLQDFEHEQAVMLAGIAQKEEQTAERHKKALAAVRAEHEQAIRTLEQRVGVLAEENRQLTGQLRAAANHAQKLDQQIADSTGDLPELRRIFEGLLTLEAMNKELAAFNAGSPHGQDHGTERKQHPALSAAWFAVRGMVTMGERLLRDRQYNGRNYDGVLNATQKAVDKAATMRQRAQGLNADGTPSRLPAPTQTEVDEACINEAIWTAVYEHVALPMQSLGHKLYEACSGDSAEAALAMIEGRTGSKPEQAKANVQAAAAANILAMAKRPAGI